MTVTFAKILYIGVNRSGKVCINNSSKKASENRRGKVYVNSDLKKAILIAEMDDYGQIVKETFESLAPAQKFSVQYWQTIIEKGTFCPSNDGPSAWSEGIFQGDVEFLNQLIDLGIFVDCLINVDGDQILTGLSIAIKNHKKDLLLFLLGCKANPFLVPHNLIANGTHGEKYWINIAKNKYLKNGICLNDSNWANELPKVTLDRLKELAYWLSCCLSHEKSINVGITDKMDLYQMRVIHAAHFAVVGQPLGTTILEESIAAFRIKYSGLKQEKRHKPLVMVFAGPSGHGKSYLAKNMGKILFGKELNKKFLFVDCVNHGNRIELFGASGSYQGAQEGSLLNNFLSAHNGKEALIVLDEFEKTDSSVKEACLGLFDTGEYFDKKLVAGASNQTKMIDCSKVIFILTTNQIDPEIVAFYKKSQTKVRDFSKFCELRQFENEMKSVLKTKWSNPLVGRINRIIPFFPFDKESVLVLAESMVTECLEKIKTSPNIVDPNFTLKNDSKNKHFGNVVIEVENKAFSLISNEYDLDFGARSLEVGIDYFVFNPFVTAWRKDDISNGDKIQLKILDNGEPQLNIIKKCSIGCPHYDYLCKISSPCCDELFSCNLCHDSEMNHVFDRYYGKR